MRASWLPVGLCCSPRRPKTAKQTRFVPEFFDHYPSPRRSARQRSVACLEEFHTPLFVSEFRHDGETRRSTLLQHNRRSGGAEFLFLSNIGIGIERLVFSPGFKFQHEHAGHGWNGARRNEYEARLSDRSAGAACDLRNRRGAEFHAR